MDAASGFANTRHNALGDLLLFYLSTNGLWIVFPAAIVLALGARLRRQFPG